MKKLQARQVGGKAQAGFTIIELVVVILLLGILTATALPRFLDISDDAHGAVVDAHVASLATAAVLFRASWFAKQRPAATLVDYSGTASTADDLFASANGFPSGNVAGTSQEAFPISPADCEAIFDNLIQTGGTSLQASAIVSTTHTTDPTSGEVLTGATSPFTAWTGEEFAAGWIDNDGTADATNSDCVYYYMGQFTTEGSAVRFIRYSPDDGAVTQGTTSTLTGDP